MANKKIVDILLPLPFSNTFSYYVSIEDSEALCFGSRVVVNFGKRKLLTGIVIFVREYEELSYKIKPIEYVYDYNPIISKKQFELWSWIAEYYCCSLGEVLNAAVLSVLLPGSESKVFFNKNITDLNSIKLTASENKALEIIQKQEKLSVKELAKQSGISNPLKVLSSLQEKDVLTYSESVKKGYSPYKIEVLQFKASSLKDLESEYEKVLRRKSKQNEIIQYLSALCTEANKNAIEVDVKSVIDKCKCSKTSIKSLEDKGLVKLFNKEVSRFAEDKEAIDKRFKLSPVQENAYNQIVQSFEKHKPVLLHGVTSSGKTEIYIKLIESALENNKNVLYLLPEIALTTQIIQRLKKHFGNIIGVYHSKYSNQERAEVYKSVLSGDHKIILGARSAILLSLQNIGLIIVDEEHDASYKQIDPAPRYNARDTALVLAKIHNSDIILGTATPSVESFHNCESGKYSLVTLSERFGNIQLPEIVLVDLKDAYRRKIMKSKFHPVLVSEMQISLDMGQQVILFQNRRGFSPYIQCLDCGHIPMCSDCNVSMTYHKHNNKLVCHYCGKKDNVITTCSVCKSTNLNTRGIGTEQIEEEASRLFPEAVVKRLDYDTTRTRTAYEKIIADFAQGKIDILIGTQMVSKGLDFENVNLAGIINADNQLNFPDFRAFERSFQMLSQVSGRAGRRKKQGKVIIQTYDIEHPVLKNVVENDFLSLYKTQVIERRNFKYPPFYSFIIIKLKHTNYGKLHRASASLANSLQKHLQDRVKGPEAPVVSKIKNNYIKNIHIRFEKSASQKKVKQFIIDKCNALKSISEFSSVNIQIDVDPV